jgi:hypothetical protein
MEKPMWRLYLGTKSTGISVRPDDVHPSMYRIHWPDQPPSDIVNLTRAKDAATLWAARDTPGAWARLHWKRIEKGQGSPPMR